MEEFFSINGAANFLDLSRSQVYRLLERGLIRSVRIGDKTLLTLESVNAYKKLHEKLLSVRSEIDSLSRGTV